MSDEEKLEELRAQNRKRAEESLKRANSQSAESLDDNDTTYTTPSKNELEFEKEDSNSDDESIAASSVATDDMSTISSVSATPSKASERRRLQAMQYKARLAGEETSSPVPTSSPTSVSPNNEATTKRVPGAGRGAGRGGKGRGYTLTTQSSQGPQPAGPLRKIGRWIGIGRQTVGSPPAAATPAPAAITTRSASSESQGDSESGVTSPSRTAHPVRAGGKGRRRGANYYKEEKEDFDTAARLAASGLTVAAASTEDGEEGGVIITKTNSDPKAARQMKELAEARAKEIADKKAKELAEKRIADKKAKVNDDKKATRELKKEDRRKEIEARKRDRENRRLHQQLAKAQEKAKGFLEPKMERSPAAMRAFAILAQEDESDDSEEDASSSAGRGGGGNGLQANALFNDVEDDVFDLLDTNSGANVWKPAHGRVLRRWLSSKVETKGFFVNDLMQDLRDGEVLHVLLLCLFEEESNLPSLPPRPQAGVGSGPRIRAVKATLQWLVDVFGSATPLHGLSLNTAPLSTESSKSTDPAAEEVEEGGSEGEAAEGDDSEDKYLESIARGVVEGDEEATLSTVWAMWQGWSLLKFVPLYAEATSHVGCSESEIVANLQAGEVHEGLREWLCCYFSELVRYGHKELNKDVTVEKVVIEEIPANCPGNHGLTTFRTNNTSWWCSSCSNNIKKGVDLFGCRTCDYDLCRDCFEKMSKNSSKRSQKQMTAKERAAWALSSGSNAFIGSVFSLADAEAVTFIQQATFALCGHDLNSEADTKLKLTTALNESSLILGVPLFLDAKEFSYEKVSLMFLAELANCSESSTNHQQARDTADCYLHALAVKFDDTLPPPAHTLVANTSSGFPPRAEFWRVHALEMQFGGVLSRERRQRKALAVTTETCMEMEAAIAKSRQKRANLMRRMTELGEEVEALESAQKAAALEVHVAKTKEKGYQQQLKGLSDSNEAFISKLKSLEGMLQAAEEVNKARELADEMAAKEAANEKAMLAKQIPTGHIRVTVMVKKRALVKRLKREESSDPTTASLKVVEATEEKPQKLLYTCDASLPVSYLLSMVLRDCEERDDLIGLRKHRRDNTASSSSSMLELHHDLNQVCSDGDVLEAVQADTSSPSSLLLELGGGDIVKESLDVMARKRYEEQVRMKQLFDASSSGKGVSTVEAFRVQRVVLTNWINYKVAVRNMFVDNLFSDLSDGFVIKHLLEVVTGELLDSYVERLPEPESFYEANQQEEGATSSTRRILGISLGTQRNADRDEPLDENSAHSSASGSGSSHKYHGSNQGLSRQDKLHNMTLLFRFMGEKGILSKQPSPNEKKGRSQTDVDEDEVRPTDIVDGNPSCTLQLIYAIAVYTALCCDWGVKLPPRPSAMSKPMQQVASNTTSAATSGVPLNCGRRLVNWSSLRKLLIDFVSPRLRFASDIPKTTGEGDSAQQLSDLGPSLIDGKVILALLHYANPKECPYDPFPEDWANSSTSSTTAAAAYKSKEATSPEKDLKRKKELTCEEVEIIRRTAFTRANVLFGCPPILSDGSADELRDRGVGSESAPVAFRFESLGMIYLSELCIRIAKSSKEYRDAAQVAVLTHQLEASVKRERRASMALTRSDLARRAEVKTQTQDKQLTPILVSKTQSLSGGSDMNNGERDSAAIEALNSEKEEISQENSRLSSALIRIKLEREDLSNQVHDLTSQLTLANERAKKAEALVASAQSSKQDRANELVQLTNLKNSTKLIKKDRNTLKKSMLTLKEKTLNDFSTLSNKVNDFNKFHFAEMEKWKSAYQVAVKERRKAFNDLMEFRGNIRVLCRVRDPSSEKVAGKSGGAAGFHSGESGVKLDGDSIAVTHGSTSETKRWSFPRVFPLNVAQEEVFAEVSPMIQSVLDGYHACIFAYGQTGTGKTHTMQGDMSEEGSQGVQPRALALLLQKCSNNQEDTSQRISRKLSVSIMEIYMEKVRDLLDDKHGTANEVKHEVRQGANGNFVPGLTEKEVSTQEDINHWIEAANHRRSQAATDCNLHSSRSHLIMQVSCESFDRVSNVSTHGKLHLIDLAGSERIKQSQVEGQQLKETLSINKSLSSLSEVIAARALKRAHTPYRNSTLTFLLQDALSGDSKMAFIVCVSAAAINADETFASLAFAARAVTVEQSKSGHKHIMHSPPAKNATHASP